MNTNVKIPLIVFLVIVLGVLSWQVSRIFQKRNAEIKQAQQTAEAIANAPVQVPEEPKDTPRKPLQKLEQPKTFTVDEIPDSAQKNGGKPVKGPATPVPPPAQNAAPAVAIQTTTPEPALPAATPLPAPKALPAEMPTAQDVPASTAKPAEKTTVAAAPATTANPTPATAKLEPPAAPATVTPTTDAAQTDDALTQATELATKDPVKARELAWSVLDNPSVKEYDATWVRAATLINNINRTALTSSAAFPEKNTYTVKGGDVLVRIAHREKTTIQLLMLLNKIPDPRKIWVGQKLVCLTGDWSIRVSKSRFLLTLLRNNKVYRIYSVGIGRENRTPVGTFQIKDKVINPSWDSPEGRIPPTDPRNILGTRWMGLEAIEETSPYLTGYGIHGTTLPETVGTPSSAGCVRLRNPDVEDLYNYIPEPAAAKVKVCIFE